MSAAGSDAQDHELDAITSGTLTNTNYLIIEATVTAISSPNQAGANYSSSIKYQVKETGGAYGDVMAYKVINRMDASLGDTQSTQTIKWVHTLTAGQKTNGVQAKIFSITSGSLSGAGSCSNVQTILTLTP